MRRRAFLVLPSLAFAASADLYKRLLDAIQRIEVIDTHEHILPEAERVSRPVDFFTLASHYVMDDLSSAGLKPEARARMDSAEVPAIEKWRAFAPYWKYTRNTGYGVALRIAIRDIYDVDEISERSIERINEAVQQQNRPGLYREVLKKRARIRFAVNDEYWQPAPTPVNPEFFVLARKFDWFAGPITPAGIARLEKLSGMAIPNVAALQKAMERHFEAGLRLGMVTVKSTIAYERDLDFPLTSKEEAEADFAKLRRGDGVVASEQARLENRPFRALSNYMFHHLVQLSDGHRVPMQIHTGMQAGNGNYIEHSRPMQLTSLFLRYPRVQFDVFHIGFPYQNEAAALGKMFPNVCVDFCWMHIISPAAARRALHEMLDSVPANKIFGFGGDYRYPELSYAHLVLARRNIARVLAERVEDHNLTETEALETARWLLHDNPARLFIEREPAVRA